MLWIRETDSAKVATTDELYHSSAMVAMKAMPIFAKNDVSGRNPE